MNLASCVSVMGSSGERSFCPTEVRFDVRRGSAKEFQVESVTSEEEVFGATSSVPKEIPSSL